MISNAIAAVEEDDVAITSQQAEQITGIPIRWWYEKARLGVIPASVTFRAGKYRRFWKRSLLRWLADGGAQLSA
jgi:hypothetical protein